MKNDDTTPDVTNEVNATQDATEAATVGAAKRKKGERDPDWKRFYTLLGQFNADIVLQANEDLPSATDKLVDAICLLDDECRTQHGQGWVWDVKAQKCIFAPTE
jgi:hypothetical protein